MGELVRANSFHTGPEEPATPGERGKACGRGSLGVEGPSQYAPPFFACSCVLEGEMGRSVSSGESLPRAHCPLLIKEATVQGPPKKDLL